MSVRDPRGVEPTRKSHDLNATIHGGVSLLRDATTDPCGADGDPKIAVG